MNAQRRTFRGRGGPTDRRLPKHNARRRRAPDDQPRKPAVNKYADDDASMDDDDAAEVHAMDDEPSDDIVESDGGEGDDDNSDTGSVEAPASSPAEGTVNGDELNPPSESSNPCVKEVKHLKKRVQNIRETMQQSNSISNPKTYQDNVLNAVLNCVNEWRSIVTQYPPAPSEGEIQITSSDDDNTTFYMTSDLRKPAALAVFEMIQHSIQCGPMAGAKPGYFKRCGGDVAKVVEIFLDQVIPSAPVLIERMGFTAKQMDAMEVWKKNAQKAALEDKPPSRTALKQQQGKGTGKKAKKKMKG